jgi:K+-transporting ATPase ATPase C chain
MKILNPALRLFLLMTILTGIAYPLFITILGHISFPDKANGSFMVNQGKIVGSALIAQRFVNYGYFWPRPSAIDYNPLPSGGSNLGPTNSELLIEVGERLKAIEKTNLKSGKVPSNLLFASGSGLDPDISPEAARYQIERVTLARKLDIEQKKILIDLVEKHVEPPVWGIFGEPRVNVLRLNLALDSTFMGIDP